jgi:hypothetical protein
MTNSYGKDYGREGAIAWYGKTIMTRCIVAGDYFIGFKKFGEALHLQIIQKPNKEPELLIMADRGSLRLITNASEFIGNVNLMLEKVNKKAGELYHDE